MIEIVTVEERSAVPSIEISFAPVQESVPEPTSPFAPFNKSFVDNDRISYRPMHLSPPPTLSPSPLRSLSSPTDVGFQRDQLSRSQKDRMIPTGTRKGPDLRKEVALKAHKSKQAERRALFLSKIGAPPSPTAVSLPKTPPESPAVFHYSLPSPGLMSPLALFESLGLDDPEYREDLFQRQLWVEQVDFRRPKDASFKLSTPPKSAHVSSRCQSRSPSPPSLDQITAHYAGNNSSQSPRARIPLPAFLNTPARRQSPPLSPTPLEKALPRLPQSVGRLRVPERNKTPESTPALLTPTPSISINLPPVSPVSPVIPTIQITTTLIPRTASKSPVMLTEANLQALNSRAQTARDMMSTIRRRTVIHGGVPVTPRAESVDENVGRNEDIYLSLGDGDRKLGRRNSAPAELPAKARTGFTHAVLALPGGF